MVAVSFSDDELNYVNSLDFLRFSTDSEAVGADLDWTADERDKYLSIDGGLTNTAGVASAWSKGVNYGDGEQASHWAIEGGFGIMDPTTDFGVRNELSNMDLLALDAIGYDRIFSAVPEPGSMLGWLALAFIFSALPTHQGLVSIQVPSLVSLDDPSRDGHWSLK